MSTRHAFAILALAASPLVAQQQSGSTFARKADPGRPPLTQADYAKWETLGNGVISPDGKWVPYDFRRNNETTELRYRAVADGAERMVPGGSNAAFTSNSRWLLYSVNPSEVGGRGRGARAGGGGGRGGRGFGGAPEG